MPTHTGHVKNIPLYRRWSRDCYRTVFSMVFQRRCRLYPDLCGIGHDRETDDRHAVPDTHRTNQNPFSQMARRIVYAIDHMDRNHRSLRSFRPDRLPENQ